MGTSRRRSCNARALPSRPFVVMLALILWVVMFPLSAGSVISAPRGVDEQAKHVTASHERVSAYISISMSMKGESFLPQRTFGRADAVILGRVIRALGMRRNPVAVVRLRTTLDQPIPIVYKGYQIAVLDWYVDAAELVNAARPNVVTAFCIGCGYLQENAISKHVICEEPTNLAVGSTILAPLVRKDLFGTEMAENQYWIETAASVFVISRSGIGVRLLTSHGVAETLGGQDRYPLEELEAAVIRCGKRLCLPDLLR